MVCRQTYPSEDIFHFLLAPFGLFVGRDFALVPMNQLALAFLRKGVENRFFFRVVAELLLNVVCDHLLRVLGAIQMRIIVFVEKNGRLIDIS